MNFKQWLLLTEKIMIQNQEFRDPLFALQYIEKTHPNPQNLVVTFTEIDKVGINPKSKYETPLGIYFYPLNYVVQMKMKVPFAGDKPYINVCEFANPNKILHMTSDVSNQKGLELLDVFPKEEVEKAIAKINPSKKLKKPSEEIIKKAQEYDDYKKTQLNNPQYDQEKENDLYKKYMDSKNYYDNLKNELGFNYLSPDEKYYIYSNYSELWIATRILAYGKPILWNKNLRKCGIDGFVDHGTGTIHKNEKTQGVVFAANALKLLYSIPNYNTKSEPNYNTKYLTDNQFIKILKHRRDLNVDAIVSQADNKGKMVELIANNKPELSDEDVTYLMHHATNKNKIAEIIIEKKPELSDEDVYIFLYNATDLDQMAKILGRNNLNKLSDKNVVRLLRHATDKDQMAKILGTDLISEISDFGVYNLLANTFDKEKMAEIIIKYKKELSGENVYNLIFYSNTGNIDKIAKLLEADKTSEISDDNFFNFATDKNKKSKMTKIMNIYRQNKTLKNINKLSSDRVYDLLRYATDIDQMAQILGRNNLNKISGDHVYDLLRYAKDKDQMAKILGSDKISKLSYYYVSNLLNRAEDKKQMAQILNKYHQKKTPEIQKEIDKYLS